MGATGARGDEAAARKGGEEEEQQQQQQHDQQHDEEQQQQGDAQSKAAKTGLDLDMSSDEESEDEKAKNAAPQVDEGDEEEDDYDGREDGHDQKSYADDEEEEEDSFSDGGDNVRGCLPRPDDADLLRAVSKTKLSRAEIRKLGPWAYLAVGDKLKRSTWHFPVRQADGRINILLLKAARSEIQTGKRMAAREDRFALAHSVVKRLRGLCTIVWPGVPEIKIARCFRDLGVPQLGNKYWAACTSDLRNETEELLQDVEEDEARAKRAADREAEQDRIARELEEEAQLEKERMREKQARQAASLVERFRAKRMGASSKKTKTAKSRAQPKKALVCASTNDQEDLFFIVGGPDDPLGAKVATEPQPQKKTKKLKGKRPPKPQAPALAPGQSHRGMRGRGLVRQSLRSEAMRRIADKLAVDNGFKDVQHHLDETERIASSDDDDHGDDNDDADDNQKARKSDDEENMSDEEDDLYDEEDEEEGKDGLDKDGAEEDDEMADDYDAADEDDAELDVSKEQGDGDAGAPAKPVRTYGRFRASEKNAATQALRKHNLLERKPDDSADQETKAAGDGEKEDDGATGEGKAESGDDNHGKTNDDQEEELEEESKAPKDRSAAYRKILERENAMLHRRRAAKGGFGDEEAEEEDLDDGVDDFGNLAPGSRKFRSLSDEREARLDRALNRITAGDLENIVDDVSDGEGDDGGDVGELYRTSMQEKEEKELERLQEDLREHRLVSAISRRNTTSARLDNALGETSEAEDTDEEEELARVERFRTLDVQRREMIASGEQTGETLEDVENEAEQLASFLMLSKEERQRRKLERIRERELEKRLARAAGADQALPDEAEASETKLRKTVSLEGGEGPREDHENLLRCIRRSDSLVSAAGQDTRIGLMKTVSTASTSSTISATLGKRTFGGLASAPRFGRAGSLIGTEGPTVSSLEDLGTLSTAGTDVANVSNQFIFTMTNSSTSSSSLSENLVANAQRAKSSAAASTARSKTFIKPQRMPPAKKRKKQGLLSALISN